MKKRLNVSKARLNRLVTNRLGIDYVLGHALAQASRGKRPTASLGHLRNPRLALQAAKKLDLVSIANAPHKSITVGFPFAEFTIHQLLFIDDFPIQVRGRNTSLQLKFGKQHFQTEESDQR